MNDYVDGPRDPEMDQLTGAYVLDALSPVEREAFERYLTTNPDLAKEVAELSDTALLLGHAVEPVTPSAGLRASVLDLIGSTPQLPRLSAPDVTGVPQVGGSQGGMAQERWHGRHSAPDEAPELAPILDPTPLARQRWFLRPGVLLLGAAAAIAIFFGGVTFAGQLNPTGVQSSAPALASGDISEILAASDVKHTSADLSSGGSATLYWSNDLQRSAVVVDGATALPADKTYQLWYIDGKDIASAGTMAVTSNTVTQELQGDLAKGAVVGITVEPKGGSKQPTTTPVVSLQSA